MGGVNTITFLLLLMLLLLLLITWDILPERRVCILGSLLADLFLLTEAIGDRNGHFWTHCFLFRYIENINIAASNLITQIKNVGHARSTIRKSQRVEHSQLFKSGQVKRRNNR